VAPDTQVDPGTVGQAYWDFFSDEGEPFAFFTHPTELPSGLILAPDGELSGTPRSAGTFTFDVTAANLFGSATSTVRLSVGPTSGFDANGDGRPDLPVAAPGENVGTVKDAGAVSILFAGTDGRYGATGGLGSSRRISVRSQSRAIGSAPRWRWPR
jgi:hypothetical protein